MGERLIGKIALVTGAGGGIGRAIALAYAAEGADVVVNDINEANAGAVAAEIRELGRRSLVTVADVSRNDEVVAMVKQALDAFGRIDLLVNSAGVAGDHIGVGLTGFTEADWDRTYEVNLKAHFLICRAVVPQMIERKTGKIVNISSIAGREGSPGTPHYAASKAGVISFTQSLALELAPHRINVNTICPGFIWTPMWERMVAGLQDGELFSNLLGQGERSALFASQSFIVSKRYGEHGVYFFYLRLDDEIARVEIPQWVARDESLLNLAHSLVLDQCQRGQGYPVALSEAHEQAVVTGADRENFWQLVESSLVEEHLPSPSSAKSQSKRTRWI